MPEERNLLLVLLQMAPLDHLVEQVKVVGLDGVSVTFFIAAAEPDLFPDVGSELVSEVGEVSDALIH